MVLNSPGSHHLGDSHSQARFFNPPDCVTRGSTNRPLCHRPIERVQLTLIADDHGPVRPAVANGPQRLTAGAAPSRMAAPPCDLAHNRFYAQRTTPPCPPGIPSIPNTS